jgi:hypothetical protein
MDSKTISKITYLNKIQKEIDNSTYVNPKYKLKVRAVFLRTRIHNLTEKSKLLQTELTEVEKKLEDILEYENKTLPDKLQKVTCPCGSVVQRSKLNLHKTSKKHCLYLDKMLNVESCLSS